MTDARLPPERATASGLTPVEISVLRAIDELGGAADAPHVPTLAVLERVDAETGVGRRYSQQILADLVVPWVRHLPLVDGYGNFGSMAGDEAADARYTEVRLSPVGALALASERGDVGPLPLDLVEGSLYRGGLLPPFDPTATVRAVLDDTVGPGVPRTPTGSITPDPAGPFQRQERWLTRYQLGASIQAGTDPRELVIMSPPFGVGTDAIVTALHDRVVQARSSHGDGDVHIPERPAPQIEPERVPFVDLMDLSSGRSSTHIVIRLRDDVDVIAGADWVRSVWPVTVHVDCASYEDTYDRFASWTGLDTSGVHALQEIISRVGPGAGW
ncbi:hypothetical protein GCM10023258_02840 [Terrabacter aeriphilus]|uniref:Topo IIA-type catalytic domain-containing protein n=1 Tax=Terrabacter aeriphilus TaxID=515662 RepID=A0ABP9J2D2_9MICO